MAGLGVLGVSLFSPSLLVVGALAATLTGVPLLTTVISVSRALVSGDTSA